MVSVGQCVLCWLWVLVLVRVFNQVGPKLVSFLISFCLELCVLGTLHQFGIRISLVYRFWSWGYVGLGGV